MIRRGKRTETVYVDTWHESEDFVEPTSTAGKTAGRSVLRQLSYFLDAARYTAEVMKEESSQASPKRKE
ncbi:MAG: hypothetical protein QOH21_3180 [Acidobacteriota bacterium]|nr:hypothetical protein [Acidobacteriota bacterium]